MTSTTHPLPHSTSHLALRRESSLDGSGQPYRLNWPIIFASVSASFALVAGVLAWIATHPHKEPPPPQSLRVASLETPTVLFAPPTPFQAPIISATPAFHHAPREERTRTALSLEEESPSLPPPQPRQQKNSDAESISPLQLSPPPKPKRPAGETYGTQVLFLNKQEAAAETARQEHKLMFVMHISGNFEDSCFT